MKNIYATYVILSADNKNNSYILSAKADSIQIPYFILEHSEFLKEESRYILKSFFKNDSIVFGSEYTFNFIDVQNLHCHKYLINTCEDYNEKEDINLLYGGFCEREDLKENLYWTKLEFDKKTLKYDSDDNLNSIISETIDKSNVA